MPDRILLLGSSNADKVDELRELLAGLPWEFRSLADFPPTEEPEEDAQTFQENAFKKAAGYGARFQVPCIADDSGLVVDALGGAPGVHSARYAGEGCTYADNNAKLLRELETAPAAERTARFACCAAVVFPGGPWHAEMGFAEGVIAGECRGANGFGYDPLFIPHGDTRTFGEIPREEKQRISHRGKAFRKLRDFLAG